MEIDVHGLLRLQAQKYILDSIEECYKRGDTILNVIHGSNNGTTIRSWLRNSKTLGDKVVSVSPHIINSPDVTTVTIKRKKR